MQVRLIAWILPIKLTQTRCVNVTSIEINATVETLCTIYVIYDAVITFKVLTTQELSYLSELPSMT